MKKEKKRPVTVQLPEGLVRAIKAKAAREGTFLNALILDALEAQYDLKEVTDEKS